MKRILISLGVITFASAALISATGAFFSDTETSTGNTFASGGIDLKVDSQAHYAGLVCTFTTVGTVHGYFWEPDANATVTRNDLENQPCNNSWTLTDLGPTNQFFNLSDLKPGDSGENTLSLHVVNNDAYACAVIDNMHDDDLSLTSPEFKAGDLSSGPDEGEMAGQLHFFAWNDNGNGGGVAGDNIWNGDEQELFSNVSGPASDVINGKAYLLTPIGTPLPPGSTNYIGIYWCYGIINVSGHTLSCDGSLADNKTQTDKLSADISFYVEQARNNPNFTCTNPTNPTTRTITVAQSDLDSGTSSPAVVLNDGLGKWFFYNDTNDTVMSINQFTSTGGVNEIDNTDGEGAARMKLDLGTDSSAYSGSGIGNPRYNIATYQFAGIKLADITALGYRVYDETSDGDKPFLNFNIDFDGTNTWQHRLVYVPTTLTTNTWTTVDAIQGGAAMWTYSGLYWPAGVSTVANTTLGTTARSWTDIKADYPNARILPSDPWVGVRVGEPGPTGAAGAVSSFTIGTTGNPVTTYDFGN